MTKRLARHSLKRSSTQRGALLALEPRMMFDAAGLVTAVEVAVDAQTDPASYTVGMSADPDLVEALGDEGFQPPAYWQQERTIAVSIEDIDDASGVGSVGAVVTGYALESVHEQVSALLSAYLNDAQGADRLFESFDGNQTQPDSAWLARAADVLAAAREGSLQVEVRFLDGAVMGQDHAAFAAQGPDGQPVIFLNHEWWQAQQDPQARVRVLIEETGHYIDHLLNPTSDTQGDEGEAFAARVLGETPNFLEAARIYAEQDQSVLRIDGVDYQVELATYSFVSAYEVNSATTPAGKESNTHDFDYARPLAGISVDDTNTNSRYFSGNDVSAIGVVIGGETYYGWISRPIKSGGIVRGFYFWTDSDFPNLAAAQADGNTDGDRNVADNRAFLLVVDQAYFDGLAFKSGSIKNVGSSSDRVDSSLNSLIVPNGAPTPANDLRIVSEDSSASTGNVLLNDSDPDNQPLSVTGFSINGVTGVLGQPLIIAGVGSFTLGIEGNYTFAPAADFTGTVPVITYSVTDGQGDTASASLLISVTPVNDAPTGSDNTVTARQNGSYTFSTGDFGFVDGRDSPADTLRSVIIVALPAQGSLTLNGVAVTAGQEIVAADLTGLRYAPPADQSGLGLAQFTFRVRDNGGTANGGVDTDPTARTLTINVSGVNRAPVANPDAANAGEAGGVSNASPGSNPVGNLLTNDTDPDTGDSKLVTAVRGAGATVVDSGTGSFIVTGLYGSLTVQSDGTWSYQLDNANTTVQALRTSADTLVDRFDYSMIDGSGLGAASALTITIVGSNDAPVARNDYDIAKESIAASNHYSDSDTTGFRAVGNVLGNDLDVDGDDTKTVAELSGEARATSGGNTSTTFAIDFGGSANSIKNSAANVTDVLVEKTPGTGVFTRLLDSNGNPVKVVSFSGSGNTLSVVLSDPSSLLAYSVPASPGHLIVRLVIGNKNYDGNYSSAQTTVDRSVDANVTAPGGSIAAGMTVSGVDADNLSFSTTVSAVTYDSAGNVTKITLTTAQKLNDSALRFTATPGTTLTGRYGTLTLAADGGYTYTPFANNASLAAGASGIDSFRYTMRDAAGLSSSATLSITVLGSASTDPVAVADLKVIAENATAATGNAITEAPGVDSLGSGSGTLTITQIRSASAATETAVVSGTTVQGQYGTLTLNPDGSYSYALNNSHSDVNALRTTGDQLNDVFIYRLNNANGQSASTLTIRITGSNDAPLARADLAAAVEAGGHANAGAGIDPVGNLLSNDGDNDRGDVLRVSAVQPGTSLTSEASAVPAASNVGNGLSVIGSYGTLHIGSDGSYQYVLDNANSMVQGLNHGTVLTETFAYRINDLAGGSDSSVLTITIGGANDAPAVTAPTTAVGAQGSPVSITGISVADVDDVSLQVSLRVENGKLSFGDLHGASLSGSNGSVQLTGTQAQINAALATLEYNPNLGFAGKDLLRIEAQDAGQLVGQGNVTLDIAADTRPLWVTGSTVNEASPYLMFNVAGAVGQQVVLTLAPIGYGAGHATLNVDAVAAMEFFDGSSWQWYAGGPVTIPVGDSLLVRVQVLQDSISEGLETLSLVAGNRAGQTFSAVGTIIDDGTGEVFLDNNTGGLPNQPGEPGYPTYLDDDRALAVSSVAVNEASPFAIFTVSGAAGQYLSLDLVGLTATLGADTSAALEVYVDGDWTAYIPGEEIRIPANEKLSVRVALVNDSVFEGQESFALEVTRLASGSKLYGMANIYDDGTGSVFLESATSDSPAQPGDAGFPAALDDDRQLAVSSPRVNEASDYAVFTVTGNSSQSVRLQLIDDSEGGSVSGKATVAGQSMEYFDGLDWVAYDANGLLPTLNADGELFVRVNIVVEQDDTLEGDETFSLAVTLEGRDAPATGIATINDAGAGEIFTGEVVSGTPVTSTSELDDDTPTEAPDTAAPVVAADQTFTYNENRTAGFEIGQVAATDAVGVTGYSIVSGNESGYFAIDSAGKLILTAAGAAASANDFESLPNGFALGIRAVDAAGNQSDVQTVSINVTDVDDTAPAIAAGQSFSYAENRTAGHEIGQVAATDAVGVTGYSIVSGNESGYFAIDSAGKLTLTAAGAAASANDFESLPNGFALGIRAVDAAGNQSAVQTVSINVTDVDDTAPAIAAGQSFSYAENRTAGHEIGQVAAADAVGVTGYSIVAGNESGYFAIDSAGKLTLTAAGAAAAANDFEAQPNGFALEIRAVDAAGNQSDVQTVSINITDLDDTAPVIAAGQSFNYAENRTAGHEIGQVAATDAVGVTGYSIVSGNDAGYFAVDASGKLTLTAAGAAAAANDFEALPNGFTLAIRAVDAAGNQSDVQTVSIDVTDVDDTAPAIAAGQSFSYAENRTAGHEIGQVAATDAVGVTGYSIVSGNESGYFAIDSAGKLTLTAAGAAASANDFESLPNGFTLAIRAVDAAGNQSDVQTVSINVTDVDDTAPAIAAGQSFNYPENRTAGFEIGQVAATDAVGVTGYSIVSGNESGYFAIDSAGKLALTAAGAAASANDFESLPNGFALGIRAVDAAGNQSAVQTVSINVTDVDDTAPAIAAGQSFSYAENRTAGHEIGQVAATDAVGVTGYSIVAGNESGYFAIDSAGKLTLTAAGAAASANDFESLPNGFALSIRAVDAAGNQSNVQTVSIDVTDVDDTAPTIAAGQSFRYAENRTAGHEIGQVVATDAVGVTGYSIVSGNESGYFAIDSAGKLTLTAAGAAAAANDFEALPNGFSLSIRAVDAAGNQSDVQTVSINITDLDDTAPVIAAGQIFSYQENHQAEAIVGQVVASDSQGVSGFRFAGGSLISADGFFRIDATSGVIRLTEAGAAAGSAANDFEIGANRFVLSVQARDATGNWSTAEAVTLAVTDIFEAPPVAPAPLPTPIPEPSAAAPAAAPVYAAEPTSVVRNAPARPIYELSLPESVTSGNGRPLPVVLVEGAGARPGLYLALQPSDHLIEAGRPFSTGLEKGVFVHTDANANVTLEASLSDGSPLPGWLQFDPATGRFSGMPPEGLQRELLIKVVARDSKGAYAEVTVRIVIDKQTGKAAGEFSEPASETFRPVDQVPASEGEASEPKGSESAPAPAAHRGLSLQLQDARREGVQESVDWLLGLLEDLVDDTDSAA